jgi:hypothetical protein
MFYVKHLVMSVIRMSHHGYIYAYLRGFVLSLYETVTKQHGMKTLDYVTYKKNN